MAGGAGKRLRPLTDDMPKPLVPVGGIPVIRHILRLLRSHGITEAAVTTGYLAEKIEKACGKNCEGVQITYFNEKTPLGTAGGVKAAEAFLSDDFIVISGDAMCDIDLMRVADFHREKDADVTIVLSHSENPLEYGLVLHAENGRIERFIEKPALSQAYTDTVNTGIYVISRRVLPEIPEGMEYDFGRDLFPKLLESNYRLFSIESNGYWCDIGDIEAYYGANMRLSDGENIVGNRCIIDGTSSVEGSVIMDRVTVDEGCRIDRSIICSDVVISKNAVVGEGCVIGSGSVIGEGAALMSGTRLSSGSRIPDGLIMRSGVIFRGINSASEIIGDGGIVCPENMFNTSFTVRLGAAIAMAAQKGKIGVMRNEGRHENRIYPALLRGLRIRGAECYSLGCGFEASASYAAVSLGLDLSLFIREKEGNITISLYDSDGLYPHRSFERALISALMSEDGYYSDNEQKPVHDIDNFTGVRYFEALTPKDIRLDGMPLSVKRDNPPSLILTRAFLAMEAVFGASEPCFSVSDDGFSLTVTEDGYTADMEYICGVLLTNSIKGGRIALPYTAPDKLRVLCGDGILLYSQCPYDNSEDAARAAVKLHPELYDGCFAATRIAKMIADTGQTAEELCEKIPPFSIRRDAYRTADTRRISVLGKLGIPAGDGVNIEFERGTVRVIPRRRGFVLTAEAADGEYADEIMQLSKEKIASLLKE